MKSIGLILGSFAIASAGESVDCPDAAKPSDSLFRFAGPFNTTVLELGTRNNPLDRFDPYHPRIYFPSSCETVDGVVDERGCKVLLFHPPVVDATQGMLEIFRYDDFFDQLASHGVIVVGIDADTGKQDPKKYIDQLEGVMQFLKGGDLQEEMNNAGVPGSVDPGRIIIGGHGLGVRALLERVTDTECEDDLVGGIVMLDPTEKVPIALSFTGDFDNYIPDDSRVNLPLVMPALHLTTALADEEADGNFEACAPADTANKFFKRWRGPIFHSSAVNFGHIDVCNTNVAFQEKTECDATGLEERTQENMACFRQSAAGLVLNFIKFLYMDDNDASLVLDPNAIPTAEEEINTVDFTRDTRNIALQKSGFFPRTKPSCKFDPDLLSPLVRIVLICAAVFVVASVGGAVYYFRIYSKKMSSEEEEFKKLAENMKAAPIVSGMGYAGTSHGPHEAPSSERRFPTSNRGAEEKREEDRLDHHENIDMEEHSKPPSSVGNRSDPDLEHQAEAEEEFPDASPRHHHVESRLSEAPEF